MAQEKEVSLTLFPPLKGGEKAYLHCRASAIARKTLRGGGGGGGGGDREVPITGARASILLFLAWGFSRGMNAFLRFAAYFLAFAAGFPFFASLLCDFGQL